MTAIKYTNGEITKSNRFVSILTGIIVGASAVGIAIIGFTKRDKVSRALKDISVISNDFVEKAKEEAYSTIEKVKDQLPHRDEQKYP